MPNLYVFFYRDLNNGERHTEYITAETVESALEQYRTINLSKGIRFPMIIRVTEYQRVRIYKL